MSRSPTRRLGPDELAFGVAVAAGFASSVGQILVLRELLVLFHGNELSAGVVLTAWLLWTASGSMAAGWLSQRWRIMGKGLVLGLWTQASLLPGCILFIRASRIVWSVPVGEQFSFGTMLAISFSGTALLCMAGGALFGLAWNLALVSFDKDRGRPLNVYVGEAIGAAAGGATAYYLIIPGLDALDAALGMAGIMILLGVLFLRLDVSVERPGILRWTSPLGVVTAASCFAVPLLTNLGMASHQWHWGSGLVAVRNTPYHQLALLKHGDQFTLFGNGLWYFTVPDPQTAEMVIHPVMLQHRDPRKVLLMGGSGGGLIQELLKYDSLERIDKVEQDPEVAHLIRDYAVGDQAERHGTVKVQTVHGDAAAFVRGSRDRYDVIFLNVGEPVNADQNRFYTLEFYQRIRQLMEPDAVFAFGLSGAPDVVGEAQVRYLSSVHATLRAVFPEVLILPGDSIRFLATSTPGGLSRDPGVLDSRMRQRGIETHYVQDLTLQDLMSPLRLGYMEALLSARPQERVNTDFSPTCYFNALLVWSSQIHPWIADALLAIADSFRRFSRTLAGFVTLVLLVVFLWARRRRDRAIPLAVALAGGSLLALEIVLLLALQILEGFLYAELALVLSCYMTGLALGAAAVGRRLACIENPGKWLLMVHGVLVLFLLGTVPVLLALHEVSSWTWLPARLSPIVFRCLAFAAGGIGGVHFSLATAAWARGQSLHTRIGAGLYAADLTGAALSGLMSSLLFLPLAGVMGTLAVFSGLALLGGLVLVGGVNR